LSPFRHPVSTSLSFLLTPCIIAGKLPQPNKKEAKEEGFQEGLNLFNEHVVYFENELKQVELEYNAYSSFKGFAIHYYLTYRELCENK